MDPLSKFISKLSETCKTDSLIREDGKNLNLFDRISDFFQSKHNYEHFTKACKKLSEAAENNKITDISQEKQIEILGRIRQIQKKMKNEEAKQECDQYIQNFESSILDQEKAKECSKEIFDEMIKNSKKHPSKLNNAIRKFDAIIDYCSENEKTTAEIISTWNNFFDEVNKEPLKGKSLKVVESFNRNIVKKFINEEENLLKSDNILDVHYEKYPVLFRVHLENEFKNLNKQEIYNRIQTLQSLMAKHSDNAAFIHNCLQQIEQFLGNALFDSSMQISEKKKNDILAFKDFFTIIDQYLPTIEDKKLELSLKIKCANLPCPTVRTSFPHLFLSEKDQLDILLDGLQNKENETINALVDFLENGTLSLPDIVRLIKLTSTGSNLADENLLKLRTSIETRAANASLDDWEDPKNVQIYLESIFLDETKTSSPLIDTLKRTNRSKMFFEKQLSLDEEMIMIPRWYHATRHAGVQGILKSGEIRVAHERTFRGAWVSTNRQEKYGPYTLSLSNKVTDLDPNVFIGFQFDDQRWRGIQKAVPLKIDENTSYLTGVGVPWQVDKAAQKTDKLNVITILKDGGYPNPTAISTVQLDFMQKEVMSILGTPNLPDHWWGGGKIHSDHQEKLCDTIRSVPLEPDLFTVSGDTTNQIAIGKVIQTVALPFYKEPMPQAPSYRSDAISVRVKLSKQRDKTYNKHVDNVTQQSVPARGHHGSMHCVRVALWTQLLSKVYEKLGKEKTENPILLATAGAFHDIAREAEGIDYWDAESSEAFETLLSRIEIDDQQAKDHIQTIKEKDPENEEFSSDIQRIVHDADCLDIIRVRGRWNFKKDYLCFYHFDKEQKPFCNQLIDEIGEFITLTEKFEVRNHLEHHSEDFYGDLVRLLFSLEKNGESRFPLITEMLQNDMQEILATPHTNVSKYLLNLF